MATINNWDNNVLAANVKFNGGTMNIGSDSTDNAINIGTAANAGRTIYIGNGTGTTATELLCGTGGVNIGTSAVALSVTFGSTSGSSYTLITSGSGGFNVTATNGTITAESGTGEMYIGNDTYNSTINLGTGAGVKTVTLGSTNTTSTTTIDIPSSGTGTLTIASATGTIFTAADTGIVNFPLQAAFFAYLASNDNSVTGNNTSYTVGTNTAYTKIFDIGSNFNTDGVFTAPVTGRYYFVGTLYLTNCTVNTSLRVQLKSTDFPFTNFNTSASSSADKGVSLGAILVMTAGDTASMGVDGMGEAGNTNDIQGTVSSVQYTYYGGYLAT
jgi:hypothetical protein